MKLLVIGNGLVGNKILQKVIRRGIKGIGTWYNTKKEAEYKQYKLDKTNKQSVFEVMKTTRPDVVVDTGAMHNVDRCEREPEESHRINVDGTENVAKACNKYGSDMLFISTDYIFDGKTDKKYTENDNPNPTSIYAKHKLEAEKIVLESVDDAIVVRPSVIYGWDVVKDNFVTWAYKELKKGHSINIVDDQYNNPTLADDLADMIISLIENKCRGVFHTAGSECLNRYEFTLEIAEVFGLDKSLVNPIKTEDLNQLAERPKKCCMDVDKITKVLRRKPLSPYEGLTIMRNQLEWKDQIVRYGGKIEKLFFILLLTNSQKFHPEEIITSMDSNIRKLREHEK